jgi:predicted RNA-binding protein with PUA domain
MKKVSKSLAAEDFKLRNSLQCKQDLTNCVKNRKITMNSDDDKNDGGSNSRRGASSRADSEINSEQMALLESAKDKLRMATIERKRMSSINAESRGNGLKN